LRPLTCTFGVCPPQHVGLYESCTDWQDWACPWSFTIESTMDELRLLLSQQSDVRNAVFVCSHVMPVTADASVRTMNTISRVMKVMLCLGVMCVLGYVIYIRQIKRQGSAHFSSTFTVLLHPPHHSHRPSHPSHRTHRPSPRHYTTHTTHN
jgi:hypothetical protein